MAESGDHRRTWANRAARALLAVVIAVVVGAVLIRGEGIEPGLRVPLVVVSALAILALFLTEHGVRRHRPTLHIGTRDGVAGAWIEPAELPLRRRAKIKDAELRRRTQALIDGVNALAAESYQQTTALLYQPTLQGGTQADQHAAWEQRSAALDAQSNSVMSRYQAEFSSEAMWLFDQYEVRGLANTVASPGKRVSHTERFLFEHPTNPLGMEEVARALGVWMRHL